MSIILSLVAAVSGATVPAAIPPAAVPTVETAAVAVATTPRRDSRRYCVSETPTGSRIPIKECRTRAEWAAKGVNINAK